MQSELPTNYLFLTIGMALTTPPPLFFLAGSLYMNLSNLPCAAFAVLLLLVAAKLLVDDDAEVDLEVAARAIAADAADAEALLRVEEEAAAEVLARL